VHTGLFQQEIIGASFQIKSVYSVFSWVKRSKIWAIFKEDIYIHVYIFIYIQIYIYMYKYICIYMHYVWVGVGVCVCECVCVCVCVCVFVCVSVAHKRAAGRLCHTTSFRYIPAHSYMYIYIYICIYMYVYIYTCVCVCGCVQRMSEQQGSRVVPKPGMTIPFYWQEGIEYVRLCL